MPAFLQLDAHAEAGDAGAEDRDVEGTRHGGEGYRVRREGSAGLGAEISQRVPRALMTSAADESALAPTRSWSGKESLGDQNRPINSGVKFPSVTSSSEPVTCAALISGITVSPRPCVIVNQSPITGCRPGSTGISCVPSAARRQRRRRASSASASTDAVPATDDRGSGMVTWMRIAFESTKSSIKLLDPARDARSSLASA